MRELMMSSDHVPVSFEVRLEVFRHQAAGLSRIRRWNGACDVSVAQHCVQACDLASPETAGYALIHDIEEFHPIWIVIFIFVSLKWDTDPPLLVVAVCRLLS